MTITGNQHFMMVIQPAFFICDISSWFDIIFCFDDIPKDFVFVSSRSYNSQISCRSVMIVVMETTGIGKLCVYTSKRSSFGVHHVYKFGDGTTYMFSHSIGYFISRCKKYGIEALLHSQNFSRFDSDVCALWFNTVYCFGCKRHFFRQRAVFKSNPCSHDFCGTCRIPFFIDSFCIENLSGIHIHYYRCFCNYLWSFGPGRPGIRLDFPGVAFRRRVWICFFFRSRYRNWTKTCKQAEGYGNCFYP